METSLSILTVDLCKVGIEEINIEVFHKVDAIWAIRHIVVAWVTRQLHHQVDNLWRLLDEQVLEYCKSVGDGAHLAVVDAL